MAAALGTTAVAGSAGGAALLLFTPAATFDRVVPFLLAFAALALLLQPKISAWLARHPSSSHRRLLLPGGLIATAAYDGYWGAGAGVITLALLMIATGQHLPRSNALKNMLLGVADVTCCAVFILFWRVDWGSRGPDGRRLPGRQHDRPVPHQAHTRTHTPHHRRARRARARHPPMGRKLATAISHMPAHGQRSPDQAAIEAGRSFHQSGFDLGRGWRPALAVSAKAAAATAR